MKANALVSGAVVALLAALTLRYTVPNATADIVILTNGNSTASIDTQSKAGMFNWTVDGISTLKQQWFWYRVGSASGEQSLDALTQTLVSPSDGDADGLNESLAVRYVDSSATPFEITVSFSLTGGQPGDRNSAISEVIRIRNTGSTSLEFHLFQYGDFDLAPANPNNDTVAFVAANEMQQIDPNSASLDVGVVPLPSHHQADVVSTTLSSLNDASPTTLSDADGPVTGNATYAYQYDPIIQPGSTFLVSVNKKLVVARPAGASKICVHKFYDANANGLDDDGQVVAGVRYDLNGTDSSGNNVYKVGFTDASGNLCFTNLAAGNYTVAETVPNQNWVSTTPTSVTTNLASGQTPSYSFGNLCKGGEGGLTIGFWRNKNGQALITSNDFVVLTGLCLRNADGSNRDFTSTLTANKDALKSWLQAATAVNMAYMLSAQLTAMQLNVLEGSITNSAGAVYAPGCGNTGPGNAYITISDLITAANNALCADGNTPTGDPNRALQECLKSALDDANNNRNLIEAAPCTFKSPY
jgi:hypothetical protein